VRIEADAVAVVRRPAVADKVFSRPKKLTAERRDESEAPASGATSRVVPVTAAQHGRELWQDREGGVWEITRIDVRREPSRSGHMRRRVVASSAAESGEGRVEPRFPVRVNEASHPVPTSVPLCRVRRPRFSKYVPARRPTGRRRHRRSVTANMLVSRQKKDGVMCRRRVCGQTRSGGASRPRPPVLRAFLRQRHAPCRFSVASKVARNPRRSHGLLRTTVKQ